MIFLKRIVFAFVLLALCNNGQATHLIGGNLGYEYIGTVVIGGVTKYRYKIILTTYTNCGPDANPAFQIEPEPGPLFAGIYEHDIAGVPLGGVDKILIDTVGLNRIDTTKITPELPSSCTVGATTCIFEAVYVGFINLDLNFTGYHVFYERCCRNGSIENLLTPGSEGLAFDAYIGPPLVGNSSPVFTDVPIPFLCVGDTTSILNTAVDPDGDNLVYSFVDPYAGYSGPGAPAPLPPDPTLGWPIPSITWGGGYNALQPFGAAGYSFINGATGLTAYYSPLVGDYVVAVEITEYNASGNIVGITRRDLQLLVLNCPPNPAPNIDPTAGTTLNNFSVVEGETLCFDFGFNDPNNDSVFLTVNGTIFDPLITNPPATIDTPAVGLDTVSTQFCWTTGCGQAQTLPYQFSASVTDDGCPPKTTNEVFLITVTPYPAPDTLFGPVIVCAGDTGTYTTEFIIDATYTWTITGGTVIASSGNEATIQWISPGTGNVSVTATSLASCESLPIDLDVTVIASPAVDAGLPQFICDGDSVAIGGGPTGPPGAIFTWDPATNIDDNTLSNPTVFPSTTTDYIVVVDIGGVCNGIDTVTVTVGTVSMDAGTDSTICFGDSLQLQATGGITYNWTPAFGLSDPTIPDPIAQPTTTTTYYVNIADAALCAGVDSVVITVTPLPTIGISNDTTICEGDCAQLVASGGSVYTWSPSISLSDSSINNPQACNLVNENYQVIVEESGCRDSATVNVNVNPNPLALAGTDTTICENDCALLNGAGGLQYDWLPAGSLSDPSVEDPTACPVTNTVYELTVTDANGCTDVDSVSITVNVLPSVDAGSDINLCLGQDTTLAASGAATYTWTPISDLSDPTIFNPISSTDTTITYTVTGTDINSCSNTSNITITVNALPIITVSNDTTICSNDSTQLIATGGIAYSWSPILDLSDPSISNPFATPSSNTTYTVIVTNSNACEDTAQVTVSVFSLPTVITDSDTSICLNECVSLTATGALSYLWTTAVGLSDPNIANPLACPIITTQYVVEGTDASGCINTDTVIVSINDLPAIDAGNNETICNTDSVQLLATGGDNYLWTASPDLSNITIDNPFASPSTTSTFFVTGVDTNGCSNNDSVIVFVNTLPFVTVSNDTSLCNLDSTQLIASGGIDYVWTPASNLDNPNISTPIAFPSTTTTYSVHVTDGLGCEDSLSVTITINPLPSITAGPTQNICLNDTTIITASGGISYSWDPVDSLSNSTSPNPNVWPSDTTTYVVTGIDANSCSNTDTVTINVIPLPTLDAGSDSWLCPGDSVQLNAAGTGVFLWTPAVGLSNPNIANPMASPGDTTQYIVELTDASTCANSDTLMLFVNAVVPSEAGPDSTICFGDTIQIGGNPSSITGSTFSWSPTTGLNDATLANPSAFPSVTTTYYLTTTNDTCSGVDSVVIFVNAPPPANASVSSPICLGDTAQLSASGGIVYSWLPADSLSDPNLSNPLAWPADTTIYIVQVLDTNNCIALDSVEVIINPIPNVSAGVDSTICLGDTIQLSASGGNGYTWTPNTDLSDPTISNPLAFPIVSVEYLVTVVDSNTCISKDSVEISVAIPDPVEAGLDTSICFADSVQLLASGSLLYSWDPIGSLDDPSISNPIASPINSTLYFVIGTDASGCSSIDSVNVIVNTLPLAEAGIDTAFCSGDTIPLLASGGIDYSWSPGSSLNDSLIVNPLASPENSTLYFLTVTDSNNCINMDSVLITVNALPNAFAGLDEAICSGDTIQLGASGGITYAWSPSSNMDNPSIANPNVYPDTTINYIVMVTDTNACSSSDTVEIAIFNISVSPQDTTICRGDSVQLNVNGPNVATYLWTPAAGLSDPTISNPMAGPTVTTIYTVILDDISGCSDSASATINIQDAPIPAFTTTIDAGCEGVIVEFINTSTLADNYLWSFGNGNFSNEENPIHTFNYGDSFQATLIAYNTFGCSDSTQFNGIAGAFSDYYSINIPNVFTPNNDGKNDQFTVQVAGKLFECVDMKIYNRWGQIIFISTGYNLTWDGRSMTGEKVPQGSYFYSIQIKEFEYNGHISVFE